MIERYSRPEMAALWTLEARYSAWLEVELAVCEAWAKLGEIPAADLAEIRAKAAIDAPRILEIETKTRHDVIAFLTSLEEKIGPAARFIHRGCTSSDIVDTANALLLTRAGRMILADIDLVRGVLKDMALRYKDQLCIGRTHGVHAEPTTFGLKMAGFYAEFSRHRERMAAAVENIRVGKISGAVGTYAHLTPEIEALALERLGLAVDPVSTQIIQRDRYAQYFTAIALLGGGVERLCTELRHLQRTEVLEAEEGFAKGQKGSSAMPHKKNPISAENLCGLSRILRGNALASMEDMPLWHERDISHSSVERIIMPDSTILADYILHRLARLLGNLRVIPENMARNMEASFGLFYSQRVLMALLDLDLPRQKAYEMVQAAAMRSWDGRKSFKSEVENDQRIREHLSTESLEKLFDPCYYTRYISTIYTRVFGQGWEGE